jgi:hypothetical protein
MDQSGANFRVWMGALSLSAFAVGPAQSAPSLAPAVTSVACDGGSASAAGGLNAEAACQPPSGLQADRRPEVPAPKPSTWGSLLAGLTGIAVLRYRRQRPRNPLM